MKQLYLDIGMSHSPCYIIINIRDNTCVNDIELVKKRLYDYVKQNFMSKELTYNQYDRNRLQDWVKNGGPQKIVDSILDSAYDQAKRNLVIR